jgi:predicted nucleotidyltransferase component of viral defense system
MITTAELHRIAATHGLRFDQAEKDYVILGALLALAEVSDKTTGWVFKGGTCLRHCYYPGYRFSEDIDFSCTPGEVALDSATALLRKAARAFENASGVVVRLKESKASEGGNQVEIPLEYSRGGGRIRGLPTVKFHLTLDEPVLLPPVMRKVQPYYSGLRPFTIAAYSLVEIVAEKMRALLQQQEKWPRARDLYDLWFILCRRGEKFPTKQLLDLFSDKCQTKGIKPDVAGICSAALRDWNRQAWDSQLRPMLAEPPEYDSVWAEWTGFCRTHFSTK